jgi:molybdopterin-biosynthesis enzyme MoeA-like protein
MAKPNYAFAKRQRDLAKKQKKEAKLLKKAEPVENPPATTPENETPIEKTAPQ